MAPNHRQHVIIKQAKYQCLHWHVYCNITISLRLRLANFKGWWFESVIWTKCHLNIEKSICLRLVWALDQHCTTGKPNMFVFKQYESAWTHRCSIIVIGYSFPVSHVKMTLQAMHIHWHNREAVVSQTVWCTFIELARVSQVDKLEGHSSEVEIQ